MASTSSASRDVSDKTIWFTCCGWSSLGIAISLKLREAEEADSSVGTLDDTAVEAAGSAISGISGVDADSVASITLFVFLRFGGGAAKVGVSPSGVSFALSPLPTDLFSFLLLFCFVGDAGAELVRFEGESGPSKDGNSKSTTSSGIVMFLRLYKGTK